MIGWASSLRLRPRSVVSCSLIACLLALCACEDSSHEASSMPASDAENGSPGESRRSSIEVVDYSFLGDVKERSVKATAMSWDSADRAVRVGARALSGDVAAPLADVTVLFDPRPDATRSVVLAIPVPTAPTGIEVTFRYLDSDFRERAKATRRLSEHGVIEPATR